jgi:hypothetical protein
MSIKGSLLKWHKEHSRNIEKDLKSLKIDSICQM